MKRLRHVFVAVDVRNLRQQTDGGKQPRVAANTRQDASARARKKTKGAFGYLYG
jgi:hypothetical protein